jgi:hypothetical protein
MYGQKLITTLSMAFLLGIILLIFILLVFALHFLHGLILIGEDNLPAKPSSFAMTFIDLRA